ncbi:MAG: hypothetical protein KY445_16930 [Armatimonadetes bacterium]|nr:hypothetical protein [Armatimonadota bacterium]
MKTLFLLALSFCIASAAHAKDLLQQFPVKPAPAKAGARAAGPSQSKVALKGAFPVVASKQLQGAVAATDLAAARKLVGKNALFVGVVNRVFAPRSGSIVLLNFAPNYKMALVGAVKAADFKKFPPLQSLQNQKVALSGKVISYKGRPEIELTSAGAIRVVK